MKDMGKYSEVQPCYVPRIVIDFREHKDFPVYYFGVEFVKGKTLAELIDSNPLSWLWNKSLEIVPRVACAAGECVMAFLHRDLHPGNVLISEQFEIDSDFTYVWLRII